MIEIEIYSRKTTARGRRIYTVYQTSEGEFTHSKMAKRLGVSPCVLSKRVKTHGVTSDEVKAPPVPAGRHKGQRATSKNLAGPPDWQGLGSKPRDENLKKIQGKTMSYFLK